ncbi:MAG: alpha/beta hydrolase [Vulcanimicrobiaceae bacterium]
MPTFHAADGAELSFTDMGPRGTIPLLFLHGWIADSGMWSAVVARLEQTHRTLAIDLRGFGASSAAPGPYRVETFSDDLSAFIAELDLDPLVVIGHSMGAAVAQRFAIDRPDATEGLVLVSPVPASGVTFAPKVAATLRSIPGDAARANAWLATLTHRPPAPEVVALMRRAAAAVPVSAALESFDSWTTLDFADEAATIETPTLVLASEHDRPMTPAFARANVADVIPGSRFAIVPDAAHYVPLERPDVIAEAIDRFVADL